MMFKQLLFDDFELMLLQKLVLKQLIFAAELVETIFMLMVLLSLLANWSDNYSSGNNYSTIYKQGQLSWQHAGLWFQRSEFKPCSGQKSKNKFLKLYFCCERLFPAVKQLNKPDILRLDSNIKSKSLNNLVDMGGVVLSSDLQG